ncbi:probable tubulin polyglutamylase TTLL2 [Penaeus chinensis]|uniref:probable tubulin polyglutamylase TTLL2 n=1 Tax=Penaeus chinensis TaxID=139456 RepID=UPI001FB5BECC|nr:probable tubulin polyglutamylase TTLL2 [Penaeus chinensis]
MRHGEGGGQEEVATNGVLWGRGSSGEELRLDGPIYYRVNDDNTGPELFMEVCVERGWRAWEGPVEVDEWGGGGPTWHVWWRHGFPPGVYRRLKPHQVVNHIPRANGLCKKDSLARSLQKMKHVFGSIFDFFPATYLLPCEYTKLVAEYTRLMYHNKAEGGTKAQVAGASTGGLGSGAGLSAGQNASDPAAQNIWICKPIGSSQGRGISIFQDLHELSYASSAVVQRYIGNPLLVGGYKCDVRLYVLVTSFLPLTVYVYTEGIVRFGTEKYSLAALDNLFSHLTNTSLNKLAPGYRTEKERVGSGCKWTVGELRRYLAGSGQKDWLLWQRVGILVSLTLISQVGHVPHHHNCFELYGFDILVDDSLTPSLLEVNRCPSLSYDCDVDRVVKKPMLHHMFDLLGPPKVTESISRSLKPPPVLILLTRDHSRECHSKRDELILTSDQLYSAMDQQQYNRLMESLDMVRSTRRKRNARSSVCEDCEDGAYRMTDSGSCSVENLSAGKKEFAKAPHNHSKSLTISGGPRSFTPRRRRSISSLPGAPHDPLVPEELSLDTFVPVTFNTTFQRVRRQFLNSQNNKSYSSMSKGGRSGQMMDMRSRRGDRGPHRCPARCGDWVRTFPYNAATLHASKDPLYTKTLVAELCKYKRACEKVVRENPNATDDCLNALVQKMLWRDTIIWMPNT